VPSVDCRLHPYMISTGFGTGFFTATVWPTPQILR
jgi:hypothetical protein